MWLSGEPAEPHGVLQPFCCTTPVASPAFCRIFHARRTKARVELRENSQGNPSQFGAFSAVDGT